MKLSTDYNSLGKQLFNYLKGKINMASFITSKAKDITNINNEVIANSMIGAASAGATAYLSSTMAATTPELRAMYAASLTQVLGGHSAITELAVEKGWDKPYDTPTQQLLDAYNESKIN